MTRRGGPYPYLRLNFVTKVEQGRRVAELALAGHSFRSVSAITGWSVTTCWRRYWFWVDFGHAMSRGVSRSTIPPQRGTRACPAGRPWIKALDEGRYPRPS